MLNKTQPGNPKPRMFRLAQDGAVVNRYGFNSEGIAMVGARLRAYFSKHSPLSGSHHRVLGINLGKNKWSPAESSNDYIVGVSHLGPFADYIVINVYASILAHWESCSF
jgi:dihydroorotate dehydrogenase